MIYKGEKKATTKKNIAVRLRDLVDAIPTQVHGVVMATKGFSVHQLEYSKYTI